MEEKIETVEDLLRALQRFPANAAVRINDADTAWQLKITEVRQTKGRVVIGGSYTDCEK